MCLECVRTNSEKASELPSRALLTSGSFTGKFSELVFTVFPETPFTVWCCKSLSPSLTGRQRSRLLKTEFEQCFARDAYFCALLHHSRCRSHDRTDGSTFPCISGDGTDRGT